MTLYAFDAAFPPDPSVYAANGGIACNEYMVANFAQGAARIAADRAAGVAPWPNWERLPDALVSNRSVGQAAGNEGFAAAIAAGFPSNGTIIYPYSVDVSVDPTNYHLVGDAFLGINDVNHGRFLISCYGQGGLISYLRQQGLTQGLGWLSGSTSFPGYNQASPDICMWQEVGNFIPGASTDRNVITNVAALHAYWPDGSPYALPTLGDEPVILVHGAPSGSIGSLAPTGIYHYTPTEYQTIEAIKAQLPAAVRETLMPMTNVTDAQFNALPVLRDDMQQILGAVSTDQAATIAQVKTSQTAVQTSLTAVQASIPSAAAIATQVQTVVPTAAAIAAEVEKILPPGVTLTPDQLTAIGNAAGTAAAAAIQPQKYIMAPTA
jgi:hypothetical protein